MSGDRERTQVGPEEGGRRYFELLGIFFRHDPVGINLGDNVDEYSPEVGTVLPRLGQAEDVEALASVLHEEFDLWFAEDAGPRERYLPIAQEVWARLQADAPTDAGYDHALGAWLELRRSWPSMEDALAEDEEQISQAVTAYLAGFRPIPSWAVGAIGDFEARAERLDLPTAPEREFLDRLLTLVRRVRADG